MQQSRTLNGDGGNNILVRIYSAFIDSIWKYASAWLASASKSHILRIERAQNRALRLVTGHHIAAPVKELHPECGLPGIDTEIKLVLTKSAEKAVSGEGSQTYGRSSRKNSLLCGSQTDHQKEKLKS